MKYTLQEFGQRIKQKYPAYQGVDDIELAKKVLDKYPVYQSQIIDSQSINQDSSTQKDNTGLSGIFSGAQKGLISTGSGGGSLIRKGLQTILPKSAEKAIGIDDEGIMAKAEQRVKEYTTPETTAEKIGFFLEQAAELFAPMGSAAKATKGAGLLTRVAAEGLTAAGTTAIQEGDINKDVGLAGGLAAAFPIGGKIIGEPAKRLIETLPDRLIQSALRQSKTELKAGKSLTKYVIENKRIGSTNSLINSAINKITSLGDEISSKLGSNKQKVISKNSIIDDVVNRVNSSGGEITQQEVADIVERLAPQAKGILKLENLTLTEANKLRQSIDKTLGDRGFLTSQLPFNKEILRTFVNSLRNTIKEKAPEGTKDLFYKLSKEINLRDVLLDKTIQTGKNQIISFGDLIGGGIGGIAGGGVPGALAGAALKRGIESTMFKTIAGVSLDQLSNLKVIAQKISPEIKSILIEILRSK